MHAARTPAHWAEPPDEELLARFGDAIDDRIARVIRA